MPIIPLRIDDEDLKKIDHLVKKGRYKNRSQAIKKLLLEKLQQETVPFEWQEDSDEELRKEIVNKLISMENFSFSSNLTKSAEDLIGKERERY